MNPLPPKDHNGGPELDPLLAIQAAYDDTFAEATNWADGTPVQDVAQMAAVDMLLTQIKEAEGQARDAKEAEYRPFKEGCDAVVARWKPFLADMDRQRKCLVATVDGFKRKLAAEKETVRKDAERKAWLATQAAQEAARLAAPADLEAARAADAAKLEAEIAQTRAAAAKADTVKGLRKTWFHTITDYAALLRWISVHDRDALEAFADDYARKHRDDGVKRDGMDAWQEKVAA